MDLLANYSDPDGESGKNTPTLDISNQKMEPTSNNAAVEASLAAEWESFEKMIGGGTESTDQQPPQPVAAPPVAVPINSTCEPKHLSDITKSKEILDHVDASTCANMSDPPKITDIANLSPINDVKSSNPLKLTDITLSSRYNVANVFEETGNDDMPILTRMDQSPPSSRSHSSSGSSSSGSRSSSVESVKSKEEKRRSRSQSPRKKSPSKSSSSLSHRHERKDDKHRKRSKSRSRSRSPHRKRSKSRSRSRSKSSHRKRSRSRSRSKSPHRRRRRSSDRKRSRSRSRKRSDRRSKGKRSHRGSRSHRRRRSGSRSRRHSSKERRSSRDRHRRKSDRREKRRRSRDRHRSKSHERRDKSRRSLSKSPLRGRERFGRNSFKSEKPMSFKEKMRQQLLKASKILSEQGDGEDRDIEMPKEKPSNLPLKEAPVFTSSAGCSVTPQMALLHTMASMHQKAQEMTGVAVPKYYNPAAVNPLKYAEQVQKRKLLWAKNKEKKEDDGQPGQWQSTAFVQDDDGKVAAKFRKLMGMKEEDGAEVKEEAKDVEEQKKKTEELFYKLDKEYEFARMSTHTHRGVGLGFASQGPLNPNLPHPPNP